MRLILSMQILTCWKPVFNLNCQYPLIYLHFGFHLSNCHSSNVAVRGYVKTGRKKDINVGTVDSDQSVSPSYGCFLQIFKHPFTISSSHNQS